MRNVIFVFLIVALAAGLSVAQGGLNKGPGSYAPTTDVQGPHENGGRGCAGCHAPHSGGRGGGGVLNGNVAVGVGVAEGDSGLWGTDTGSMTNGITLTFDGSYSAHLAGLTWSSGALYTGVVTCLSCHDGNVSRGAMMSGQAYEQSFGLLNFASNVGSNGQAAPVNLYGSNPIPTLLGNDGGAVGDYNNDHPVGPMANLGAVASAALSNGLVVTVSANRATFSVTSGTTYANFVAAYGIPAVSSMAVVAGDSTPGDVYVVCTTCHNQHAMNVYSSSGYGAQPIAGGNVITARTIFFVNGPYNPGASYDSTHVPSTNAFCLECHFSHSSQFFGSTAIGTAF